MPPKSYKVLSSWFKKKDKKGNFYSAWCKQLNEKEVLCMICDKSISCITKGFPAVTQHENTTLHKQAAAVKLSTTQLLLKPKEITCTESSAIPPIENSSFSPAVAAPVQLQLSYPKEAAIKAELLWAMKMVQANVATTFTEDLNAVFKAMFKSIPEGFSLGRTKLSYLITDALAPFFMKELLDDAKKSFYTLIFDETTNNSGNKELQFMIRYWSPKDDQVVCRHLCTVFLGHGTAEAIIKEIEKVVSQNGLSFHRIIMLSSDGPKVNQKVHRLLNEVVVEQRGKGLIDIGSCNLHVINNSFQKGLEEYGEKACDLVIELYYYFKKFPSRLEDFRKCQEKTGVPHHSLLKHVSSRWLTAGEACERVLEQWEAIKEYFLQFIPNKAKQLQKSTKYKRIVNALGERDILVELNFVAESSLLYKKFLLSFQSSEPLIHILHSELVIILKTLKGRVCKPEININEEISTENYLQPLKIDLGNSTKMCLEKLASESERINVCRKIQRHYMASHNYLLNKCGNDTLRHAQCLQPSEISSAKSLKRVAQLAEAFSFTGVNVMDVKDEWRLLQSEIPSFKEGTRIDHFWKQILNQKSSLGHLKYPTLGVLVKACLTLAHGNADVERGFSISKRVLGEDKSRMSQRVFNARLVIKDALKSYSSVSEVTITKDLLKLAQEAYKSHETYMEEEKRKKHLLKEEMLKEEEELRKEKERIANMDLKKKSLEKLENKRIAMAQDKKEAGSSAMCLFKEANERLKLGIQKNDFNAVRIAQGMLEGAEKLRQKEKEHEEREEKLNKIVHKRKSDMIDTIMRKKK